MLFNKLSRLKTEIQKVIVGQDEILEELIVAMLAGGHCLLEGARSLQYGQDHVAGPEPQFPQDAVYA
jgi:hypothetical protein